MSNPLPTTLTRTEIVGLYTALGPAKKSAKELRYTWPLIALRKRLKPLYDAITELQEEPEEITAYNKERNEILAEHALKEPSGDPKVVRRADGAVAYDIDPAKAQAFQEANKALTEKYKEHTDAWLKRVEAINEMMTEPVEEIAPGILSWIKLSWFKPDTDGDIVAELFPLIEYDLPEEAKK